MAMTAHEVISSRTTTHDYRQGALPEGCLERALEAACAAPNHRMTEPWRFVRIGPQTRAELAMLSRSLKEQKQGKPMSEADTARLLQSYVVPAELLAVAETVVADPMLARENYAAVACAIQNLCLSFWAEGIGSKWSTGGVTSAAETYRLLTLDPQALRIVGFVWAGYPLGQTAKPRRRKTLAEILTSVP
jgi:nitroreductase